MQAEKKIPPKPEGQIKKEQRNQRIATTLKEQREKRRADNKAKRQTLLTRIQGYETAFKQAND